MHTSAQPADTRMVLEYTGTLLNAAKARSAPMDHEGHVVPVLCFDLALDNPLHTPMHLKQYFPAGQHAQAQAAAHRFKKGQRLTVQVPLLTLSMGGIAAHVYTLHDDQPTEQPCPA